MEGIFGPVYQVVIGRLNVGHKHVELLSVAVDWQGLKGCDAGAHHVEEVDLGITHVLVYGGGHEGMVHFGFVYNPVVNCPDDVGFGQDFPHLVGESLDLGFYIGLVPHLKDVFVVVISQNHGDAVGGHEGEVPRAVGDALGEGPVESHHGDGDEDEDDEGEDSEGPFDDGDIVVMFIDGEGLLLDELVFFHL